LSLPKNRTGARWWILAGSSALLITALVAAVVYLITKKPSIVDQVVILTVPSGAEIKLDSKSFGNSPVKLEQVKVGTYTLTISKDDFETITEQVEISDTTPLEYKLKRVTPPDAVGLSTEERIRRYQQNAQEALANNRFVWPRDNSAYNYVELILSEDPTNQFALETKEAIRKRLLQAVQAATTRGDLGEAKETINLLSEFYGNDAEIRATASKLESQLSTRRGEVRDWTRKAEEALHAGNLVEPSRANALYYAKQALAIEPQNTQALTVRTQIKEKLLSLADLYRDRGDIEAELRQLQQTAQNFDDKQIRARISELQLRKTTEVAKAGDAESRRQKGLEKHRSGNYSGALTDLEYAVTNNKGTPDVIFALGHSYFQLGHWAEAATYLRQVPASSGNQYISARALLGEIAAKLGNTNTALAFYKEARQLGGSDLYFPGRLDDLIERIEKRQQEKAAAPTPVSINVKHPHGALRGSCSGSLSVDSGGVRYNGDHPFSANLVGVSAGINKKELRIGYQGQSIKFEVSVAEAERFRDALAKYQAAAAQK
jgi:thioredoxin-like negative regulator of GroEL